MTTLDRRGRDQARVAAHAQRGGPAGRMVAAIERRPFATALAAFCVGWAILCAPWLSGTVTIPYDAKAHFQAQIQFLAHALATGQSPFWNPNAFAGQPHIADPQSLIFSPALLLAWLDPTPSFRSFDAYVLGLLAMGGAATLLLFREMRWSAAGGVVAALAFAFGASAALRVQHVGQVQSLAFLMTAHWLLARTFVSGRMRDGALMGLACALMIVEPDQVALLGAYALALHVVWRVLAADAPFAEARRLAAPLAIGGVVCASIAGAPLLMTWLFVEATTRSAIPFAEAVRGSLHPASLLTGLVADLFGAIDARVAYWGPFSDAWGDGDYSLTQNMGQVYIGAAPALAIAAAGALRRRAWRSDAAFFAVAALAMLVYALGAHTPLFAVAYDLLPGVSGFRRPADATFLLGAYGAVVGGYVLGRLLDGGALAGRRGAWLGGALCACVFIAAAAVAWRMGRLDVAAAKIAAGAGWCAAAGALIWLLRARGAAAGAGVLALAALMVVDLRVNNGPNESTAATPAELDVLQARSTNATIGVIKRRLAQTHGPDRRDRVEVVGVGFYWANAGLVHDFENILGYNPLHLDAYSHATGAGDQVAGWDQRAFSPLFPSYRSLLADMLGVRLIVSGAPIGRIDPTLLPGDFTFVARTADAYIYENPRALPRVLFASDWKRVDFAEILETGRWPAFDPRAVVLLESAPDAPIPTLSGTAARVRIAHYENTRIEIEAESDHAGFVVLNDVHHPWWRAEIDGRPAQILRANVLFRAVQVERGRHRLVFTFEPLRGALAELGEKLRAEEE